MSPHPCTQVPRAHGQTCTRVDTRYTFALIRAKTTGLLAIEVPVSAVAYKGGVDKYLVTCRQPTMRLRREIRMSQACIDYS